MVSAHLSTDHIERYRRRDLSPTELLSADDHLAVCESCRERLGQSDYRTAAFAALTGDLRTTDANHISYEEMAAYVDKQLGEVDREIIQSHLQLCSQCATETQELADFAAALPDDEAKQVNLQPTYWERFVGFLRSLPYRGRPSRPGATTGGSVGDGVWGLRWIPLQVIGAAAMALILAWMFTLSIRRENESLRVDLSRIQQENERLRQDYQTAQATVGDLQSQVSELRQTIDQSTHTSQAMVALNDGKRRITLDRNGKLAGLESLPGSYQETVRNILAKQRIEVPREVASLAGKSGILLGGARQGVPFGLLGPVGTVVQSTNPTFRWQPLSGATAYTVAIYDAGFNLVEKSEPLSDTTWTATRPLERVKTYSWQVTAIKGDKEVVSPVAPAPESRFRVLEQVKALELERAKAITDSHLVLAILYAQEGLLDDAERELRALANLNPKSPLPASLVRSLRRGSTSRP